MKIDPKLQVARPDQMGGVQFEPVKSEALSLIREAMQQGKDPAYLRELLAVRREWEADEARKAYSAAKAEFQARCPIIEKLDKAYDKSYAKMDRIWRETRPLRAETGLSVSWTVCELKEGVICHVEGTLSHRQGHGEALRMDLPIPELVKGQNKAQQMGSAFTYTQRYAFCAALGVVTGEDDDGNGAGNHYVTQDQADELAEMIDVCRGIQGFKEEVFWQYAGAKGVAADIQENRYADIKAMLQKKMKGQRESV